MLSHWREAQFARWAVVLVGAIGMLLGYGPLVTFTFGTFVTDLVNEFHWTRGEVTLGYSLSTMCFAMMQPVYGRLIDRFGERRVIIPSVLTLGICLISFQFLRSLGQYYVTYILLGIGAGGTMSVSYYGVISSWFDRGRGLALGLAGAGAGVGSFLMPLIAHWLQVEVGWRAAFGVIGMLPIMIVAPLVLLFLEKNSVRLEAASRPAPTSEERTSAAETPPVKTELFWLISGAVFLMSMSVVGCLSSLVPLLTERGVPAWIAALTASVIGGASLFGRISIGPFLDRYHPVLVCASLFVFAALGLCVFCLGCGGILMFGAAFLLGVAFSVDTAVPYLMVRYFGLQQFGVTYGYAVAINVFGWVVGPMAMAMWFDRMSSYRGMLVIFTVAALTGLGLMIRLALLDFTAKRVNA